MKIKHPPGAPNLSPEARDALLKTSRDAVRAAVHNTDYVLPDGLPAETRSASGVFVSLHLAEDLRGCIGVTHSRKPLAESVAYCARAASLEDPRFPPVSAEELPAVLIEISVLGEFRILGPEERPRPGIDGVCIDQGERQGLLLPQVALRHKWSAEQLLSEVCRKANLPGDAWTTGARVSVFQAQIFSGREAT